MSKETDIVQAVRAACAGVANFRATTIAPEGFDKLADRTVYVLQESLAREDINASVSRYSLGLVLLIVSKLESETAAVPAVRRRGDDARAVYDALKAPAALSAIGYEKYIRGNLTYLTWPAGDPGRLSGAALDLTITWKE